LPLRQTWTYLDLDLSLTSESLAVSLRTTRFTINNSTWCSTCVECFVRISEQRLLFYKSLIDWFLKPWRSVYCTVRTEPYITQIMYSLQKVKISHSLPNSLQSASNRSQKFNVLFLLKRTIKVTSYGYRSNRLKSDKIRTVCKYKLTEKIDTNILSEKNGFSCHTKFSEKSVQACVCP
jgi:hypothetical protein